jgi:hypothetical protein
MKIIITLILICCGFIHSQGVVVSSYLHQDKNLTEGLQKIVKELELDRNFDVGIVENGKVKYIVACFMPIEQKLALPKFKQLSEKIYQLIKNR